MQLYNQAQTLLQQQPLPNDCPAQLNALAEKASGQEKRFIEMSFEAMYASATPEQLSQWNEEK